MRNKLKLTVSVSMLLLSCAVHAGGLSLPSLSNDYTKNSKSYLLALNDTDATQPLEGLPAAKPAEFSPPLFTSSNLHMYLGLGTIVFAGLTAITNPGEGCEHNCVAPQPPRQTSGTAHTRFARATAALAAATVTTGLVTHWNDVNLEDGFTDPDNMHAMLGTAGALLMLGAIHKSANSSTQTSHAGMAELGAAAMLVAIKLTW